MEDPPGKVNFRGGRAFRHLPVLEFKNNDVLSRPGSFLMWVLHKRTYTFVSKQPLLNILLAPTLSARASLGFDPLFFARLRSLLSLRRLRYLDPRSHPDG